MKFLTRRDLKEDLNLPLAFTPNRNQDLMAHRLLHIHITVHSCNAALRARLCKQ